MTCNECIKAKGKIIKMCDIFNAPCYDPYANIDVCKERDCKYFEQMKEGERK